MVNNTPEAPQSLIDIQREKELLAYVPDLIEVWTIRFNEPDIIKDSMFRGALLAIANLREHRAITAEAQSEHQNLIS